MSKNFRRMKKQLKNFSKFASRDPVSDRETKHKLTSSEDEKEVTNLEKCCSCKKEYDTRVHDRLCPHCGTHWDIHMAFLTEDDEGD